MSHVHIENRRLGGVLTALRELGKGAVPAPVLIRMVKAQKTLLRHLEVVNETNNKLIAQYGDENDEGVDQVTPESEGWKEFQVQANLLNLVAFDCGEPFVLYEREKDGETVIGWSDPVKTPLDITVNLIVDAGDLLVIDALLPEVEEAQVVGHIEPQNQGLAAEPAPTE